MGDQSFIGVDKKTAYVWKGVYKDGGTESKFGLASHEGKNVYAEINAQIPVLPVSVRLYCLSSSGGPIRQVKSRGPDTVRSLVQECR